MFKAVRNIIGLFLINIGAFVIPRPKEKEDENKGNPKTKVFEEKPVRFNDLSSYLEDIQSSYLEDIQNPTDLESACINTCYVFREFSLNTDNPVRLTCDHIEYLDKTGELGSNTTSSVATLSNGRWYKNVERCIGVGSFTILIDEMISSLGQDGWFCMNDSSEQLQSHLLTGVGNSYAYAMNRCKQSDVKASIQLKVIFILDEYGADSKRSLKSRVRPQISTRVRMQCGSDAPVVSAHRIIFSHNGLNTIKSSV